MMRMQDCLDQNEMEEAQLREQINSYMTLRQQSENESHDDSQIVDDDDSFNQRKQANIRVRDTTKAKKA